MTSRFRGHKMQCRRRSKQKTHDRKHFAVSGHTDRQIHCAPAAAEVGLELPRRPQHCKSLRSGRGHVSFAFSLAL